MKKFLLTLAALLLAALPARADITIGVSASFTGPAAEFGEQIRKGAQQAADDINAKGGINGEKIALRFADDACDPKQAVSAANKFVSAGVKYVVGHNCSGSAIPVSKIYMDEGILFITPSATNPRLTDDAKDLVFRACGRDDRQGGIVGEYIAKHFADKKIAIIQDESAYGKGIADEVKKTLNAKDIHEVMFEAYTPGERDYSALISKLKRARAQVLFIGGYYTETGLILRQMKEQGAFIQVIGGDADVTDQLWAIAGPATEGFLMSFGPDPRHKPEARGVLDDMRRNGYEPEGYTLYTYAAMQALAQGLTHAGANPTPLKTAAAMRKTPATTVLGPLAFDAKGDVTGPTYVIYRWHEGKYAEVME
jgi:branched-chain amino acid transport system substrate-binding protein